MNTDQFEKEQKCMLGTIDDYLKGEGVITKLLSLIAREEDFDSIGAEMLRLCGENFDADHCYVFRYPEAGSSHSVRLFDWNNPVAAALLPELPTTEASRFEFCYEQLLTHQPLLLTQQELAANGQPEITFRVVCGIWLGDRLYGFIGMDYVRAAQEFPCCRISVMNNIANLFAIAFKLTHQNEQLQDSVSLRRQIMDNLPLPILLVDLEYRVRAANPTKKIGVYRPLSELLGSYCYNTVCKFGSPPEFCSVQETMRTKLPSRREFTFDGKRLISTSQPIFDRHGEMQYVLSVDIDITEVTRQKEELEAAMKQAQSANHAKSYFLATVSHELRTPLNAVIGFSELLQGSGIDELTRQDYLRSINFAGTALLNLINDVLDLSNLEADQMLIAPEKTDIVELLEQIIAVFKFKALQKQLSLTVDAVDIRHFLYVDGQHLRQVLLNLVGNAIKFTVEGGVSIKASFRPEDNNQGLLSISVTDTGIGISPENQQKVFEPFIHDSVIRGKRMYEGSGLGLTISRRLLDKMGGRIRLESEPGKGSTFIIELKVRYDSAPRIPVLPAEGTPAISVSEMTAIPTKPLRALLIDDVPINLKVLEAMLKRLNVSSSLADSPKAALALLQQNRDYDLILTDMWMPECNGTELAQRIRQELKIIDIPILAITADTQIAPEDRKVFTDILHKPVTAKSLKQMLCALDL